jgi:hypothetical protein
MDLKSESRMITIEKVSNGFLVTRLDNSDLSLAESVYEKSVANTAEELAQLILEMTAPAPVKVEAGLLEDIDLTGTLQASGSIPPPSHDLGLEMSPGPKIEPRGEPNSWVIESGDNCYFSGHNVAGGRWAKAEKAFRFETRDLASRMIGTLQASGVKDELKVGNLNEQN